MEEYAPDDLQRLTVLKEQLEEAIRQLEATVPSDPDSRARALARAREALRRVDGQLRAVAKR